MILRRLYTIVYYLLTPFVLTRWLIKSIKEPAFRQHIKQRFGFYHPLKKKGDIWFHAVSFGEVEVARPLIAKALDMGLSVLVTSTTASGYERAVQHVGSKATIVYAPLDLPFAVKGLLKQFSPKKCVIIETEIWPNLYYFTKGSGCSIIIANARLLSLWLPKN